MLDENLPLSRRRALVAAALRTDRMDAPYWRKHLSEVRRVNV